MIALYLIAAHMLGDFILQSRRHAALKLADYNVRANHVITYAIPFIPIAAVYSTPRDGLDKWSCAALFMVGLVVLHFLTDSRRFKSSAGDVLEWIVKVHTRPSEAVTDWIEYLYGPDAIGGGELHDRVDAVEDITMGGRLRFPPPNPWPPMPLMIDQALHLCQLAVLGGIFFT